MLFTRIHHDADRATRSGQRQDKWDRHVHGGHLERHNHDLSFWLSGALKTSESKITDLGLKTRIDLRIRDHLLLGNVQTFLSRA